MLTICLNRSARTSSHVRAVEPGFPKEDAMYDMANLKKFKKLSIEIHAKSARKAGATEQELAEATLVAAALRAGGAVTHGTHTLE